MACGEGHVILFEMEIGESLFVHCYGLFSIPSLDWKFFFSNRAGFGPFDIGIRHLPGSFLWILFILFEELVEFFSSFGEFGYDYVVTGFIFSRQVMLLWLPQLHGYFFLFPD